MMVPPGCDSTSKTKKKDHPVVAVAVVVPVASCHDVETWWWWWVEVVAVDDDEDADDGVNNSEVGKRVDDDGVEWRCTEGTGLSQNGCHVLI